VLVRLTAAVLYCSQQWNCIYFLNPWT